MQLTWNQIQELHQHKGQIDIDSNKVFVRFHGRPLAIDSYEGEMVLEEARSDAAHERFSISQVLSDEVTQIPDLPTDELHEEQIDGSDSQLDRPLETDPDEDNGRD